ncbi:MAG: PmoA family protein [Gimesia sp.]|nr:PmoA family protein [Gimesia sp.]
MRHNQRRYFYVCIMLTCITVTASAQKPRLTFTRTDHQVEINVNDKPVASYVFHDKLISRPFFAHVKTPRGVQVTRNHPPRKGDRDDHATMHPGIWLAFGDLDGADFWRNKAQVKHIKLIQAPLSKRNRGSFIQLKRYIRPDNSVVCDEEFRVSIRVDEYACFFFLESIFSSKNEFYFGDQEEMGLGVRVATPMSEVSGGTLLDSKGRQGAKRIWSHSAAWCDYSGEVEGKKAGMTIMCHPDNFRKSWFHARDYGLSVANTFGRAAMKKGEPSKVFVKPGETLRLRYAVWVHSGANVESIKTAYKEYVNLGEEQ